MEETVRQKTASLHKANQELKLEIAQKEALQAEREKIIEDLEHALPEVRQLSGMLPICAQCKKICDDSGSWKRLETYISGHSEAVFTHGICPGCAKELYPDLDIEEGSSTALLILFSTSTWAGGVTADLLRRFRRHGLLGGIMLLFALGVNAFEPSMPLFQFLIKTRDLFLYRQPRRIHGYGKCPVFRGRP